MSQSDICASYLRCEISQRSDALITKHLPPVGKEPPPQLNKKPMHLLDGVPEMDYIVNRLKERTCGLSSRPRFSRDGPSNSGRSNPAGPCRMNLPTTPMPEP